MIMSGWWLFQSWLASSVSPSQTIPSCHVHSCGWSVYCVWLWRKWNSVNPPFIFIYFSQAFPATGLWHPSVTQWAELHITLEQQGIKLPQKNKKFNFEKLEKMHLRDKQLRAEFNLKVVERGRDLMITSGKDTLCPSGDNLRSKSMTDRLCWKSFMTLTKTTPSKTNVSLPGNFQWECVFFFCFVFFFRNSDVLSVSISSDRHDSALRGDVVCRKQSTPAGPLTSHPFLSVHPLPWTSVKTSSLN